MSIMLDVKIEYDFMNQLTTLNNIVTDLNKFCENIVPAHSEYSELYEELFSITLEELAAYTTILNRGFQSLQKNMFPKENEDD